MNDTRTTSRKPNIILINCDDLGYGDLACYGSKVNKTPYLDKMAEEGVRFTDYHVMSPVCSASRAALLTGCYPQRVGILGVLFPADPKGLHPDEITIADVLKGQGYRTKIVGKWHCGDQPEFLPTRHGFDAYYGLPYSNDMGIQGKPEMAYRCLVPLVNRYWYNSLASTHNAGKLFNMDISGGLPAVLIKMLVASQPGEVRLLPARPAAWPSGTIEGVLCRGQIEIKRLHWDGQTIRVVMLSQRRQDIVLHAPDAIKTAAVKRGEAEIRDAGGPNRRGLSLPWGREIELELTLK